MTLHKSLTVSKNRLTLASFIRFISVYVRENRFILLTETWSQEEQCYQTDYREVNYFNDFVNHPVFMQCRFPVINLDARQSFQDTKRIQQHTFWITDNRAVNVSWEAVPDSS